MLFSPNITGLLYLSILLLIVFFIPSCCFKTPSFYNFISLYRASFVTLG